MVIVIVLTIFMLMGREDLRNRFIRLVAHGRFSAMTQALDDAGSRVSRYLLLQFIVNSGFGLVIGLGLYFIGIPNALLWGVVAAVLRFLPYIGAPLSAVVPILLSLALFTGWTRPAMTIGLYVVVELIVANFLEPLLYGGQTRISSFAILFAAIFWTLLWGPIGLVLSTPFTVCLVVLGRHVPRLEFLNILLGDEPVPPGAHYYQRLLANDQEEAEEVLHDYLKEHSLGELYDSALIPALSLAEQDSYTNDLEEGVATFILQSTQEFVEEFGYTRKDDLIIPASQPASDSEPSVIDLKIAPKLSPMRRTRCSVLCVPCRNESEEVVCTMLAQLLERAGCHAQVASLATTAEMLTQVRTSILKSFAFPRCHHSRSCIRAICTGNFTRICLGQE